MREADFGPKSFKFAEYSRVAGPGRAGSPIQVFELILNNAPALRAGQKLYFRLFGPSNFLISNRSSNWFKLSLVDKFHSISVG
jgi:hypothetical protein